MFGPHSLDKIKNQKLENDWLQVPWERIFWDKSVDLYTSLVSSSCNGQLVLSHPSKLQHVGMLARIFLYSLSGFKDCLVCSGHLSRSTIYDSWPRHSLRTNLYPLYSQRCKAKLHSLNVQCSHSKIEAEGYHVIQLIKEQRQEEYEYHVRDT